MSCDFAWDMVIQSQHCQLLTSTDAGSDVNDDTMVIFDEGMRVVVMSNGDAMKDEVVVGVGGDMVGIGDGDAKDDGDRDASKTRVW